MEYSRDGGSVRVLMLPWLGHGHVSPFLELAKKLTTRNFKIYFCSTPPNLNAIRQKIPEKFSLSIHLIELHLPSLPDLPPHYHTTKDLPPHLMPTLKKAFDMASPSFGKILEVIYPDLLIYDLLQPWAPALASSINIPAVEFLTTGAAMASFSHHVVMNPDVKFPFPAIYLRDYEVSCFNHLLHSSSNGVKDMDRVVECTERSSRFVLIKSFREMEGKYIDYFSELAGKKIVPVGPLVQESIQEAEKNQEIIEWLNNKEKSSTLFVSFGTEYFPSTEEIHEIAHGLHLSNMNFVWVLRFHAGEKITAIEEALPRGFLSGIGDKGMVVDWAPQTRILAHSSVGGFVSHCGWSSVMESLSYGVPIVTMPMHIDQPINARVVEEVGVGVEVNRDGNGRIRREEVARVIKEVVVERTGESVRKRAREMRDEMRRKRDQEIDFVVEELLQLCIQPNYVRENKHTSIATTSSSKI